jgi:anaerobic selenocysteine-containing dehydrogenase
MKKMIFIILFLVISTSTFSQNSRETQTFLIESIENNPPKAVFAQNGIMFRYNTDRSLLNELMGYQISNDYLDHVFIYSYMEYYDQSKRRLLFAKNHIFDIRSISRITTSVNSQGSAKASVITLHLRSSNSNKARVIYQPAPDGSKYSRRDLSEVKILINYDPSLVSRIKKAIIHLGNLNGVEIQDADYF